MTVLAAAMSASEPRIPEKDAPSQNHSCMTDELAAVDSSLQNQEKGGEKETQSDAYPSDPLGAETVVSDGTSSTSSDESDTENFSGGGYTLLPQEPGEETQSDWTASGGDGAQEEEVVNTRTESGGDGGAGTGPVGAVSRLEDSQVQAIKQAMSGFSLPVSAVPQWAKVVPEDVWKAELIGALRTKPKSRQ